MKNYLEEKRKVRSINVKFIVTQICRCSMKKEKVSNVRENKI